MIDVNRIHQMLPHSALEPNRVAWIKGFRAPTDIAFYEPPAGQREPYVDAYLATSTLLEHHGWAPQDIKTKAKCITDTLVRTLTPPRWIYGYCEFQPKSPILVAVSDWLAILEGQTLIPTRATEFLRKAVNATIDAHIFYMPDRSDQPYSINTLPPAVRPTGMTEFVPGPLWIDDDGWEDKYGEINTRLWPPYMQWRESIQKKAKVLEQQLGKPVGYFCDVDDHLDDDYLHRNLQLHFYCSFAPECDFVQFICQQSGATSVAELQAALLDPDAYSLPFELSYLAFPGAEIIGLRFTFREVPTMHTSAFIITSDYSGMVG